ncbi:hypothetical protein Droror1_Dr00002225 [Drosera rotundifolia]
MTLRLHVDQLEKDRDFYFGKFKDIGARFYCVMFLRQKLHLDSFRFLMAQMATEIKRILYAIEEESALAEAQKILSESIDACKTDASSTLTEKSQEDGQ